MTDSMTMLATSRRGENSKPTVPEIHQSRLSGDRTVYLFGYINEAKAQEIVQKLSKMDLESSLPIHLKINSPGGEVASGIAIYDHMKTLSSPIHTYCLGQACSMASLILSGGKFGQRRITQNSTVMIHEPIGGTYGKATDIKISCQQIDAIKHKLITLYSQNTRKGYGYVKAKMKKDHWMNSDEAKSFGLVDQILPNSSG